jgi:hypothetical protein
MDRREFLKASGTAVAASNAIAAAAAVALRGEAHAEEVGPSTAQVRRNRALDIRVNAAQDAAIRLLVNHPTNGEEEAYPSHIANYSKGLPHNDRGEVDPNAYRAMMDALTSGDPARFEAIPMGGPVRLTSPQSAYAFDLVGPDSHSMAVRPAPRIDSPEGAGELAELYWMALARDVPFSQFETDATVTAACQDLSKLSDFHGPKDGGRVTPGTIFRGTAAGSLVGPLISQFLWLPMPMGSILVDQRQQTTQPGIDHLTHYDEWLAIQRGAQAGPDAFDSTPRYIRSMRDIGQWVHVDALYQAYHTACLILLGMGAPIDPGLPPVSSRTQAGFVEFGGPHILTLVTEVATRALKATWYQKWLVHRRLRPEAFAARVHHRITGTADYPVHPEVLNSGAAQAVFGRNGNYLLPMAFAGGCPTHPSYTAGHATVAGACVTILKAFFDESFVLSRPVVPDADGQTLQPYSGLPLTVGNELNKLANNVGIGRNMAGVHYRSDNDESLLLGESIALQMLAEQKACHNQQFSCALTTFSGRKLTL